MSAFCEDDIKWDEYFDTISSDPAVTENIPFTVFEWYADISHVPAEVAVTSAATLIARDVDSACALRVVVAPSQTTCRAWSDGLRALFTHYSFPSAVLTEAMNAVTHSFGAQTSPLDPSVNTAWMHFLSKEINVRAGRLGNLVIVDDGPFVNNQSQAGSRWKVSDYVLHVRRRPDGQRCVTLVCFGPPIRLVQRFRRLQRHPDWKDVLEEPFLLLAIVYDELYQLVDGMAWKLADVFRPMEHGTLEKAKDTQLSGSDDAQALDFTGLHNVAKHCIYLNEAVEASLLTLENMSAHLKHAHSHRRTPVNMLSSAAMQSLAYRKTTFQSTQLRLRSLSSRMDNIISLSFNLVTQQDSRTIQNDSNAMKAIAVLTLIFLPLTGIASLFSTPFFNIDFDSQQQMLQVASCFWIFWVITAPVTIVMFAAWLLWYRQVKSRRKGQQVQDWPLRTDRRS